MRIDDTMRGADGRGRGVAACARPMTPRKVSFWCVAFVALLWAVMIPLADGAELSPKSATYTSPTESHTFELTANGEPVPADAVSGTKILIGTHDYDYMFDAKVSDGKVVLTPTDKLEIGSYKLVVKTASGDATAHIYAPLSDMEGTLQHHAEALGVSTEQAQKLMGLATETGRETLEVDIAPVYFQGQTVSLSMAPEAGREYEWLVDGRVVQFGEGPHTFNYTFMGTGLYGITYVEYENGEPVAGDAELVSVVAEPATLWEAPQSGEAQFEGPDGYSRYVWKVDGVTVGRTRLIEHDFKESGLHTVECLASEPQLAGMQEFRKITYAVTVP